MPASRADVGLGEQDRQELADALAGLAAYRSQVDARRAALATAAAEALVTDLVPFAANLPDRDIADELCIRIGTLLHELAQSPVDDRVDPNRLAEALITAAAAEVRAAEADPAGRPEAWRAPWRVLTAVADILPYPYGEAAAEAIGQLRDDPGGRLLPATPPGPAVTGTVLWTRDAYGSRFGITAAITTGGEASRWYLWDIDTCGHQAFTVHSGFYHTPDQALAAWQAGVGLVAAGGTTFTPVDDEWLLADLMPAEEGFLRAGGESADQFAEYHRGKRLGQAVTRTIGRTGTPRRVGPDADTAAAEFTVWLRTHRAEPTPQDLDELATELADSWCINHIDAVYATCSPHRVALNLLHIRNYYRDEFADRLIALLPDWTRWLAERSATPPHLADRCLPYARGETHTDVGDDDSRPRYLIRVTE